MVQGSIGLIITNLNIVTFAEYKNDFIVNGGRRELSRLIVHK